MIAVVLNILKKLRGMFYSLNAFIINSLFWIGWMFCLWEIIEDVRKINNGNYITLEHGYYGLFILTMVWLWCFKRYLWKKSK